MGRSRAEAFRGAGIDLATLAPADAGAKIKARPLAVALAMTAAIDDWAAVRRGNQRDPKPKDGEGAVRLSRVAQVADPDPWRGELRGALDQADPKARLAALQGLAKTAKADELGPVSLQLLGAALRAEYEYELAESVLRRAWLRHPRDVWVNYELGGVLRQRERPDEAIRFYTAARAVRPETAHELAHALLERGDVDEAVAVFRELVVLRPEAINHLGCLRVALEKHGRSLQEVAADLDRAAVPLREAVRLKPDDAGGHAVLARTLFIQGKLDEAIAEVREVKRLDPNRRMDWAMMQTGMRVTSAKRISPDGRVVSGTASPVTSYVPTDRDPDQALCEVLLLQGNVLRDQGKLDEAIVLYQEAIRLKTSYDAAYPALVQALKARGKLDEAVTAAREAVRLKPDDAVVPFHLGGLLQAQGDLAGALALYRKGHELGSKQPNWKYPSAEWIAQAEREASDEERIRAVLKGEAAPKDNNERLRLARTCEERKWFAAAARLTAAALENDPKLGGTAQGRTRHQAAGRAVLAGVGQGKDDPRPDEAARIHWRAQARDWFRADLRLYANRLDTGDANDRKAIANSLQHWKVCPDLVPVRDPETRKILPEAEQKEWQSLWEEVEALLKRAQEGAKGGGRQ